MSKNDISEFPFTGKKNSLQEQGGTYKVRGETVEVTSTVNDDIGYTYSQYENILDYKFGCKDIDYDNDIKTAEKEDISDYPLEIAINKKNASTVDIQTVVKQGKPTLDELERLAVDNGENWKKRGRRLGVGDKKPEELDQRHDQMSEKAYQVLKHWWQKNGRVATYEALCDGLLDDLVQRKDLAETFCYIINGNYFAQY